MANSNGGFDGRFAKSNMVNESAGVGFNQAVAVIEANKKPVFKGEILLCEDNEISQRVFRDHIQRVGLNIVVANNGKEGLDLVSRRMKKSQKPFDLIFMDIYMPVMSGMEAAKALEQIGNQTPLVALTSNISADDVEIYRKHNIPDSLGKPFTTEELWACLFKYFTPVEFVSEKEWNEAQKQKKLKINFIKRYQNTLQDINEALASKDIKLAHRIVHTLGGLAGMMGKPALQKTAKTLQNSLAKEETACLDEQMNAFERELELVLTELLPLLEETSAPEESEQVLNKEKAREVFAKLEPLLKGDSARALKLTEELKLIPQTNVLIEQIEEYEFEMALETLDGIKQSLGV